MQARDRERERERERQRETEREREKEGNFGETSLQVQYRKTFDRLTLPHENRGNSARDCPSRRSRPR